MTKLRGMDQAEALRTWQSCLRAVQYSAVKPQLPVLNLSDFYDNDFQLEKNSEWQSSAPA